MKSRIEYRFRRTAPLVALALAAAVGLTSADALASSGDAALRFDKLVHDFGRINDAKPVTCEFPFKNTGSTELVISGVKPSCGCTTTELDKDHFGPGETYAIDVEWAPKGFGKQSKTINVRSNDPANPYVQLTIKADIAPLVQLKPLRADFGEVRAMREHVVDVAAKSNDPGVRIVDATSRSPYVIPNVVVDDKGNTVLKIVLSDRAPKGRFNASVKLRLGGTPAGASKPVQYEMDLPVAATLFHFVQPDPNAFFVGRVDPGGSVRHSIRLVHADGAPFKVVTADVTGDSVSGLYVRPEPFSEGSRRGVDLVLQGPVGSHMGQLRGKVHVVTDIPGEGPLQFDIMGMVRTETKK